MRAGVTTADKRILWVALILGLILTTATALVGPSGLVSQSPLPSSYSAEPGGALAAYRLLGRLSFPVQRWLESPSLLPKDGTGSVLILAQPTEAPAAEETKAVQGFVRSGGRVVYCGRSADLFFETGSKPTVDEWREFPVLLPSVWTRGADKIVMSPTARWNRVRVPQVVLYGAAEEPMVIVWRMGAGQLIWWAGCTPLSNAGITRDGNLQLLLNTVADDAGQPLRVYWDEYFHGQRGTLWSYVAATPVAWGLLQILLVTLTVVFTYGRRSGPILEPGPVSRLSPLEFVTTMGGLYQKAKATSIPVETSYQLLRRRLTERLRLPPDTPNGVLAKAAGARLSMPEDELLASLEAAESGRPLPARQALTLVQALARHTAELSYTRGSKENIVSWNTSLN